MAFCLGLDIGGTKCAVVLGESGVRKEDGVAIIQKQVFTTSQSPDETLKQFFAVIDDILPQNCVECDQLSGIGISCGGPLDTKAGLILSPPNLCRWDNIPIVQIIRERYHTSVILENDANACALAEWKFGAAQGYSNVIFLTFGTGLGAGIIMNNRLCVGASGMAGEVGHFRLSGFGPVGYGKSGSFEGFCSGGGIAQLARQVALEHIQRGEKPAFCPTLEALSAITAKSVAEAADRGDPLAKKAYEISGDYLGRGLSVIIDILNPELIVLGSIFCRSQHLLRPAMERTLLQECLPMSREACRIIPSGLGENIGDYAAISLVW